MRASWIAVALGVLALGLAGGLVLRERLGHAASVNDTAQAAGSAAARSARAGDVDPLARRSATGRRPTAVRMPLPPPNTPIGPVFDELVRAARAGDPGAMCRLAFEGHRCEHELRQVRDQEELATDILVYGEPEERSKSRLLRQLELHVGRREALETLCAGVELPPDLRPWRLLRDAARAGHVPSMLRFAEAPPIELGTIFDDMEALEALRDERSGFLERAADAGNAKAAYVLFLDNTAYGSMFARRDRDPVLALAYGLAIEGIGSEKTASHVAQQVAMLRKKLGAADRRKAEQLAARLAPGFTALRGSDADLRMSLVDDGSDCAVTDPRALMVKAPKPVTAAGR